MLLFSFRFAGALVSALGFAACAFAQTPTYSEHIAPIIYNNCSSCHHEGAIAPFSLMSYNDAANEAFNIKHQVMEGHMPPWPPNPTYSQLAFERTLTQTEKQLIADWVDGGAPEGDPSLAPAPPVFSDGPQIGASDLTKQMETYTVQSTEDEYRCFVVPSGLTQDQFIQALEVIPGNRSIVHHVLLFYDTTLQSLQNDLADPLPGYVCVGGPGSADARLIGSWVPGSQPQVYPTGMGVPLEANGYFVMQVHYAPGSQGQQDSTEINIKFSPPGFTRPVFISAPLEHTWTLTNGPLHIPPHTVKSFHSEFILQGLDVSVLAVGPHMHLRGKSIEAFGVHPSAPNDTIKFIRIPKWDFHWQGSYMFPKLIKVAANTKLHANAVYDNTSANEHNPDPTADVWLGEGTEDEMMLVYFAYTFYMAGDENIVIDSAALVNSVTKAQGDVYFGVYPNPADNETTAFVYPGQRTKATLRLLDVQGRAVKEFWNSRDIGANGLTESVSLGDLAPGVYFLSLESAHGRSVRKLNVFR